MYISTKMAKSVAYRLHYKRKAQYDRDCEGLHRMPAWGGLSKRERKQQVQAMKEALQETFNCIECDTCREARQQYEQQDQSSEQRRTPK